MNKLLNVLSGQGLLLAAAGLIIGGGAMVGSGTLAGFQATATNNSNVFNAGILRILQTLQQLLVTFEWKDDGNGLAFAEHDLGLEQQVAPGRIGQGGEAAGEQLGEPGCGLCE